MKQPSAMVILGFGLPAQRADSALLSLCLAAHKP